MPVPGAFELPLSAMALAKTRRYACVVALGCVIRGETAHFDYVAGEAACGLQLATLETGVPVAFGVLTVRDARAGARPRQQGRRGGRTALEMADVFAQLRATAQRAKLAFRYHPPDVQDLLSLWEEARLRSTPEPLDGRHQAALQPEPPARPRPRERQAKRAYVCTRCLKAGKVQKAV